MKSVEIYTSPTCGYCRAAKALLARKGVAFSETDVIAKPEKRAEMVSRANGGRTVPQIFIDGEHIGGFDEMNALERRGKLDAMLA